MIISRGRNYIFVHIPKTGGTSMALALEARAQAGDILIGDTPKARARRTRLKSLHPRGRLWKHSTLADIDGVLAPSLIAAMFTFTLVRNPWDRMVSYYHWLRKQGFAHPAVALARAHDFTQFVLHPQTAASFARAPAAHYMADATGTERANLYIRLEHLHDDIAPLTAHLGFVPALPHSNRSQRAPDYRAAYTDDSAAAVAQFCAADIARFGYGFD